MSPELEEKLTKKYPKLFRGKDKLLTESLMPFGCEHSDGWFNIISRLCDEIDNHLKRSPDKVYEFFQIKEKFGTLRIYDNGHDEFIGGLISMAEAMSSVTCEVTGMPGGLCRSGRWYRTLCREQAEKDGYVPVGMPDDDKTSASCVS